MIDVALGIHLLLESAEYFGSTTANTRGCFDALKWKDKRDKPTFEEIETAYLNFKSSHPEDETLT